MVNLEYSTAGQRKRSKNSANGWYLHEDIITTMCVRRTSAINGLNTLHRIIFTLHNRPAEPGMLRDKILVQVVHCPHGGDVVSQESSGE